MGRLRRDWIPWVISSVIWLALPTGALGATPIASVWAPEPIRIDGVHATAEWALSRDQGALLELGAAWMLVSNDAGYLYILLDVVRDTTDDPPLAQSPWGDYVSLALDVDGDRNVTPRVDLAYGLHPGSRRVGRQFYLRPGATSGLQATEARLEGGFGVSVYGRMSHRIWEIALPFREFNSAAGRTVRLGVKVHSQNPLLTLDHPVNSQRDFTNLIEIQLARPVVRVFTPRSRAKGPAITKQLRAMPKPLSVLPKVPIPHDTPVLVNPVAPPTPPEAVIKRRILPGGDVEIEYSNGSKKVYTEGGIRYYGPDGKEIPQMVLFMHAQPPTPPPPPSAVQAPWFDRYKQQLLGIIRSLVGHDEDIVATYLESEGEEASDYERVERRIWTIDKLTQP